MWNCGRLVVTSDFCNSSATSQTELLAKSWIPDLIIPDTWVAQRSATKKWWVVAPDEKTKAKVSGRNNTTWYNIHSQEPHPLSMQCNTVPSSCSYLVHSWYIAGGTLRHEYIINWYILVLMVLVLVLGLNWAPIKITCVLGLFIKTMIIIQPTASFGHGVLFSVVFCFSSLASMSVALCHCGCLWIDGDHRRVPPLNS